MRKGLLQWQQAPYLLPGLLLLVLFVYFPIAKGIYNSFFRWDLYTNHREWIGFRHYAYIFQNKEFWLSLSNNLRYILVSLFFQVVISVMLAAFLQSLMRRGGVNYGSSRR